MTASEDNTRSAGDQTAEEPRRYSDLEFYDAPPAASPPEGNGSAVAGFVLAVCAYALVWTVVGGFVCWLLGVIFSAVGYSRARQMENRKNYGFAVAGLALSAAGVVLTTGFVVFLIVFGTPEMLDRANTL